MRVNDLFFGGTMGILDSIITGANAVVNAGARNEMGMDVEDYKRTREGKSVGLAGKISAAKKNQDMEKLARERLARDRENTQDNANNSTKNKESGADLDYALKKLEYKDPISVRKMDDEEIDKIFTALYESGKIPSGYNFSKRKEDQLNGILAYMQENEG